MILVKIQQLDSDNNVWREFQHYADNDLQVDTMLDRISLAYNLSRTRVLVNGIFTMGFTPPTMKQQESCSGTGLRPMAGSVHWTNAQGRPVQTPRGECPKCGRTVSLTLGDCLRSHVARLGKCAGA